LSARISPDLRRTRSGSEIEKVRRCHFKCVRIQAARQMPFLSRVLQFDTAHHNLMQISVPATVCINSQYAHCNIKFQINDKHLANSDILAVRLFAATIRSGLPESREDLAARRK
jgi:hypothetical protein